MEERDFDYIPDMRVKIEGGIHYDAKITYMWRGRDCSAINRERDTKGGFGSNL